MACSGKLYFIGMGLSRRQITEEAINALRESDIVIVDMYTSFYGDDLGKVVEDYASQARIILAERSTLEEKSRETVLSNLLEGHVLSIVSAGDPFIATTHSYIRVEAKKLGCITRYIPGISIYSYAISLSGLYNYKFGASATLVYPPNDSSEPSPHAYNIIRINKDAGFHTFLFLDISAEKGPMRPNEAVRILLNQEKKYGKQVISQLDRILVLERLGFDGEKVFYLTANDVLERKWDNPPYSIIIPGKLNPVEQEILEVLWG